MQLGLLLSLGTFSALFLNSFRIGKKNNIKRTQTGRELGWLERWYSAHQGRGDRNICYIIRMHGNPPSLELMTEAMVEVASKHRGLHCHAVPSHDAKVEPRQVVWETLWPFSNAKEHPWFPSISIVKRENSRTVNETVQQQVNTDFPLDMPPWRVHLVSNSECSDFEIIISINHLVADGISGMILCREFLAKLTELQDPTKKYVYPIEEDPFFAIEELIDTRPKLFSLASKFLSAFVLQRISLFQNWKKSVFVPMGDRKECIFTDTPEMSRLSSELTKQLLSRCKEEKTTCHAVICVVSHIVMAHFENSDKRSWTHAIDTPINLRPYGRKIQSNALGVLITSIEHKREITPECEIWALARLISKELKSGIPSVIPLLGMIAYVPNLINLLEMEFRKYPAGRKSTICLSNLGYQPIDIPEYYSDGSQVPWKFQGINFTQQHHVGSGASFMASIVTCAGQLQLSICSSQPVIPVEWNKEILDRMLQTFELIAKAPKNSKISDILDSLQ